MQYPYQLYSIFWSIIKKGLMFMKLHVSGIVIFIMVVALLLCAGCTREVPPPPTATPTPTLPPSPLPTGDPTACTEDSHCVPAQCCHPTSCINYLYKQPCTDVVCTLECSGPLDCGAGHCGCVDGKCQVIPGPGFAPVAQSTLIIAIKDAPKTTDIGTITHLWLNISEVSVHRASANQTVTGTDDEMTATESDDISTAGWTVVVNRTRTVDLMQLTNVSQDLGQKTMDAGKYTQIRLKIDSGTITVNGTGYSLDVPSGVLKLTRGFVLEPDTTLKLTLDFNVEKSVVRTGSDQYKLKPVIAVTSG